MGPVAQTGQAGDNREMTHPRRNQQRGQCTVSRQGPGAGRLIPLALWLALAPASARAQAEFLPDEAEVPTAELPLEATAEGAQAEAPAPPAASAPAVPPPPAPDPAAPVADAATGSPAPEGASAAPETAQAASETEPPAEPAPPEATAASPLPPAVEPPPATEPPPAPTATAAADEAPARSRARRDREERTYARHRPSFGVSLNTSLRPFGDSTSRLPGGFEASRLRGVQAAFEYQPAFLQAIGVLGVGPSFTYAQGLGSFTRQLFAPGLQARYQARFFREQLLVPMAGYEIRYLRYLFPEQQGNLTAQGPFFGAMLLMNFLEPDAAADAFIEHGISRTYLIAELRSLTGSDATVSLAGRSLFFGLRFEF